MFVGDRRWLRLGWPAQLLWSVQCVCVCVCVCRHYIGLVSLSNVETAAQIEQGFHVSIRASLEHRVSRKLGYLQNNGRPTVLLSLSLSLSLSETIFFPNSGLAKIWQWLYAFSSWSRRLRGLSPFHGKIPGYVPEFGELPS